MKQAFTSALFAAAAAASAADVVADVAVDAAVDAEQYRYQPIQKSHVTLNDHYDNGDKSHKHYGGKGAASPAHPSLPHV